MTTESSNSGAPPRPGSRLLVVLAWAVVGIPALWGISMTARTAMKLFHPTPAQTTAARALSGPTTAR
jgi:hypothetical protein